MHPPIMSLLIITSLLLHIPMSFCQDGKYNYEDCGKPFKCGSLENVSYPFYGEDRPEYCGYPGFELKCESDDPLITIQSVPYRVLKVNDSAPILTVARYDLWEDICRPSPHNTTPDLNTFKYSMDYPNITIYYGCSLFPGLSLPNEFCTSNSNGFSFYLTMEVPFSKYASSPFCDNNITVPINPAAFPGIADLRSSVDNLSAALRDGFELDWFANNTKCSECTQSGGRCGHADTNSFICYCADGTHDTNICRSGSGSRPNLFLKVLTAALVTSAIILLSIIAFCYRRRKCFLLPCNRNKDRRKNGENIEAFMKHWDSVAMKQYSYSEIKKITNSFLEKLGQGGYGSVYKGKLPDGRQVAVKVLSETKDDGQDFINEVSSISRTSHVNVVTLLGFCYYKKRVLVYEFMPNGSLDKFVSTNGLQNSNCLLEWKKLYQIAVGIARGLEYLHRGCNTRIVHFDIKPHNILLDGDFCPKISDFGLAKLSKKKESILTTITARGTPGYTAPEVFFRHFGGVSHKSDVYSYGMMVLEMVGVKKNVSEVDRSSDVYFPQWIYEHLELGKDLNIQAFAGEGDEELSRKMMLVGLWCIQTNPSDRPSISKVVEMLEGGLHSLQIPPKPFLISPKGSPQHPSASFPIGTNTSEGAHIHVSAKN